METQVCSSDVIALASSLSAPFVKLILSAKKFIWCAVFPTGLVRLPTSMTRFLTLTSALMPGECLRAVGREHGTRAVGRDHGTRAVGRDQGTWNQGSGQGTWNQGSGQGPWNQDSRKGTWNQGSEEGPWN